MTSGRLFLQATLLLAVLTTDKMTQNNDPLWVDTPAAKGPVPGLWGGRRIGIGGGSADR